MFVRRLELDSYRSWRKFAADFTPGITVFVGENGQGKTNIVEALGVVAHLSSHRVSQDAALVYAGEKYARISVTVVNGSQELTGHLMVYPDKANQAQINRTKLPSARGLLGLLHTVLFAPEDLLLVRGEPAERRQFLDEVLLSLKPRLAGVKADYEKVLRQRRALLRSAGSKLRRGYEHADGAAALATLDVWDAQLAGLGAQLIFARLQLLEQLRPFLAQAYQEIAPNSRPAKIAYKTALPDFQEAALLAVPEAEAIALLEAQLLNFLAQRREQEIERGMCLVGPHRDDVSLLLGEQPAKGFASHGETWTYAICLRLSVFFLLKARGSCPVLILDDVFAELDTKRREALCGVIAQAEQVFITAAVGDDLPAQLAQLPHQKLYVQATTDAAGRFSELVEA